MEKNKLRELIEQAKMGNNWAKSTLTEEYKQPVRSVCRTMIKDEAQADLIAQDAFRAAFDRLAELDGPEEFLPWVTQIAREKCGGMRVSTGTAMDKKKEKRLSRVSQSAALQKPVSGGALSNDVIYPQAAQPEPAKKKSRAAGIIVAASVVLVLALAAGVVWLFAGRSTDPDTVISATDLSEYVSVSDKDAFREFRKLFADSYSYDRDKVCFVDVTNDGEKEMVVIKHPVPEESELYIYTLQPDGRLRKEPIYAISDSSCLGSTIDVGLYEYDGVTCLYEREIYSQASGDYREILFYLDGSGRIESVKDWGEISGDEEAVISGIYNINRDEAAKEIARDIRDLGRWPKDVFGDGQ